ncbi:putative membrane protein [Cytobacillus horneckiae]|uniref:LiaI-LiaF-like domain-containing protein n=1 Tax=Cytobacillus horneckiae TaxID=549687 RepID=UPI001561AEBB|nr:DUF5668 domain-containing protein [Cytobacillus horneckiae]MBN6887892.1 hypothetical protein [Cytobacillus horneckiae]MCM3179694.1 DUF5668 domain-containing protein [Cytobacillus horneckiae]NRG46578.1 hypothetical protein [Bacillus sp. CRN 9]
MKKQRIFPGVVLIGFGLYFLLQQANIESLKPFFTWPTLLLILGLAFLFQAYIGRDYDAILPGVVLAGFGLHFLIVHRLAIWPDHIGIFILIISLGFLLRHLKTGNGLFQGMLFLLLAVMLLFYDKIFSSLGEFGKSVSYIWNFWPILFILIGFYFLISKKR